MPILPVKFRKIWSAEYMDYTVQISLKLVQEYQKGRTVIRSAFDKWFFVM